jgi:hypothetical protein
MVGSQFPNGLDNDTNLPGVSNNLTQIGGAAINALRSAVFAIENTLGSNVQGTAANLASFLSVSFNPNGTLQPSALTSLGLVTLPITNAEISPTAGIQESKLALAYTTTQLNSFIQQNTSLAQQGVSFIANHGYKLEPHIAGTNFQHYLNAILVAPNVSGYYLNDQGNYRNNGNLSLLFNDLNNDYIAHQLSNGLPISLSFGGSVISGGTLPPTNYAHNASGIFLETSNFSFIPQNTTDLQSFAEFVDSSNLLLLGSRIQTLYANGIPRTAYSSSLLSASQGQLIVQNTPAQTFLLDGYLTYPVDDINHGDDIIMFLPSNDATDGYYFDAQFAAVRVGDYINVNYGAFSVSSIVLEKKYLVSPDQSSQTFAVRIDGKNLSNGVFSATITRSLFNNNKYGVLALAQATSGITNVLPSLICGNPQSAEALSVNFNANQIDSSHYNLYLAVYPNGNPANGIINVPAIDISGNAGSTPGAYTLASVVQNINNQFRKPGYNNRFIAFSYNGELGIKMSDSINNISFSILDGAINPTTGLYNQALSNTIFPNNVIGVPGIDPLDASGLGPNNAGFSGPQYSSSFSSSFAASIPAKVIAPGTRKTYYISGTEGTNFPLQPFQSLDSFGDGYWTGTIITKNIIPGVRVEVTYQVPFNLSTSSLQVGKTITVIAGGGGSFVDSGRFFISNIQFNDCSGCETSNASIVSTNITVYDAIQAPNGVSPYASAPVGTPVSLYFSADSIYFDAENASDSSNVSPFKRFMEVYADSSGNTFSHERGRIYTGNNVVPNSTFGYSFTGLSIGNPLSLTPLYGDASQNLINLNIIGISPQLRGFPYNGVSKINLQIFSYSATTGNFDGYLCNYNIAGNVISSAGALTSGKKGEVCRFYDETNVAFIDILIDINSSVPSFTNAFIDIQLFPSLGLDGDVFLLGTVQVDNKANVINYLNDRRQFGNISPDQLSTSSLDLIASIPGNLSQNGIIRGFNLLSGNEILNSNQISFSGGIALINGQQNSFNPSVVSIPLCQDYSTGSAVVGVLWAICANQAGDIQIIPLTDYNSLVNAINNPGRLMQLFNVSSLQNYSVDSTIFSEILNYRKDLTILYLANAQITSTSSYTISISDARKFVTDANGNSVMVLSIDDERTNFKSFGALSSFAYYNAVANQNCYLRGTFNIVSDPGFAPLRYKGDGAILNISAPISLSSCSFDGCTFNLTSTISLGSNVSFTNCIINASSLATAFNISGTASNIKFSNCTISYAPSTAGTSYSSTNLINSSHGFIYSSVSLLENLVIDSCTFATNTSTRFPFVSLEYNATSSIAQTIKITNNQFSNTSSSDDQYAVIAATCTLISSSAVLNPPPSIQPTEGLKLINCTIENNLCDKDQMISITGAMNASQCIACSIVPVNCRIIGNACGTISVVPAADNDRNYETYTNGIAYDKGYGTIIAENTCRYIGMLSSTGQSTFQVANYSPDGYSPVSCNTGSVMIRNNTCSWIEMTPSCIFSTSAIIPYQNGGAAIFIHENSLRAYNIAFLFPFCQYISTSDILNSGISLISGIINYGSYSPGTPSPAQIFASICKNIVSQGSALNSSNSIVTYDYNYSLWSAIGGTIDTNTFNNITASGTMINLEPTIIGSVLSVPDVIFTNNKMYRNANSISSYINCEFSNGIISNNFFDSSTVDSAGINYTLITGSLGGYTITQNFNQVGFSAYDVNQLNWYSRGAASSFFSNNNTLEASWYGTTYVTSGSSVTVAADGTLDLSIPYGAKLLFAVIGFKGSANATNALFVIYQGDSNTFSTVSPSSSSFSGTQADLSAVGVSNTYTSNTLSTLSTTTSYCYINLVNDGLRSTLLNPIRIALSYGTSASDTVVAISSVLLKWTW